MRRALATAALVVAPLACSGVLGIHDIMPPSEGGVVDASQEAAPHDARPERDEPESQPDDVAEDSTGPTDAPEEPCTADASSDPLNCGACGHSCLGAPCSGGVCTPTVLVDQLPDLPVALVVDATNLYLAAANYVDYCPLAGCAKLATPITHTGNSSITSITSLTEGAGVLYFTAVTQGDGGATGQVLSKVVGQPGVFPNVLSPSSTNPTAALTCGGTVCWIDTSPSISSVFACTPPSCASPNPIWKGMVDLAPTLAWDGTLLYFSDGNIISSIDLGNPMPAATVAQSQDVLDVTFAGTRLYWFALDSTGSSLMQCTPGSCSTTTIDLAKGMSAVAQLAADDQAVYWTVDRTPGEVDSCPVAGCAGKPHIVAAQQPGPQALVIDASKVYWAASTGSAYQILWVAR